jgi:hypothetical protein
MRNVEAAASARLSAAVEIAVAVTLAAVLTALCVSASMQYGRLAGPPGYDDVTYFYYGQKWLNSLATAPLAGLHALLDQHAPLMTLTAALSFVVLGPFDWAPYIAFGFLVGVVLFAMLRFLVRHGLPVPGAALLVTCLASVPFFRFIVTEFRPDHFAGIATAFGVLLLFEAPVFLSSPRRQFALGLLFGLALLWKPTAFLATGFVLTVAVVFSLIGFAFQGMRLERPVLSLMKSLATMFVGACLVFLPHLAVHWRELFAYVEQALFSNQQYWALPGTALDHLVVYAVGQEGGGRALGFWFWVAIATFLLRLASTVRFARRELPVLAFGYASVIAMYAAISATPVKTYFLGSMFYATLLLFMLRDWAWLARQTPTRIAGYEVYPAYAAIAVTTVLAAWLSVHMLVVTPMGPLWASETTQSTDAVSRMIDERLPERARPFVLLANNPNPVKDTALGLRALRDGHDFDVNHQGYSAETPEAFMTLAGSADLVLVVGSMENALPGPRMGNALQNLMRSHGGFKLVGSFQPLIHPRVEVYERIEHNSQPGVP